MPKRITITMMCVGAYAAVIAYLILSDYLSPDAFRLVILMSMIALFVGVLIEWKLKDRAEQRADAEFRKKHPPTSVTRYPVNRK